MTQNDERHGTYAGALAHAHDKEPRCEPCREAYNAYMREYRSRPEANVLTRMGNRARSRAVWRLAEAHRAEFDALYAEELRAERVNLRSAK